MSFLSNGKTVGCSQDTLNKYQEKGDCSFVRECSRLSVERNGVKPGNDPYFLRYQLK